MSIFKKGSQILKISPLAVDSIYLKIDQYHRAGFFGASSEVLLKKYMKMIFEKVAD